MVTSSARAQRAIVEECLKWISQRKAFGKPLASQAVIRSKVAAMIARVEAVQSWLENITHQMNNMVRPFRPESRKFCTQCNVDVQGAS
jgi:alkylation response protein AidB-like acyl-CoA dehydrogenase